MIKRLGHGHGLVIDLVPAAMMGAAVAILCLLCPVELLERLAVRSGLDLILPPARPPLGLTARLAAAGCGFAGTGVAVFAVLRLAGRLLAPPAQRAEEEAFEPAPPPVKAGRPLPLHAAAELPQGLFTDPGFHAPDPEPAAPTPEVQGSIAELLSRLEGARAR